MSDTLQLAIVAGAVLAAAVYLFARWRRPKAACDACPTDTKLVQIGSKPTAAGRRPPSAS